MIRERIEQMTYPPVSETSSLKRRYQDVLSKLRDSAERSSRSVDDITLVAITKTHPASVIREAIKLGMTDFGESRVQEAESKITELGRQSARWHLVGHLQANKARRAVQLFDVIHSVDSVSIAERLERLCEEASRPLLEVLIQVDLGGEETKSGIAESELEDLVATISECPHLKLIGLMTLPPFFDEPELVRPFFRKLRTLRDELKAKGSFGELRGELSMGMTNDFEIAIEEGATMVRVGTAIFGVRERLN
jgi:pyridoxal phosphate enzyme (YggS family)